MGAKINNAITAKQLVQLWRARQDEIVRELPPELLAEFSGLERCIKETLRAAKNVVKARKTMVEHKRNLVAYLADHGPSTRDEMVKGAGVPPGSLSMLLAKGFKQVEHGLWAAPEVARA